MYIAPKIHRPTSRSVQEFSPRISGTSPIMWVFHCFLHWEVISGFLDTTLGPRQASCKRTKSCQSVFPSEDSSWKSGICLCRKSCFLTRNIQPFIFVSGRQGRQSLFIKLQSKMVQQSSAEIANSQVFIPSNQHRATSLDFTDVLARASKAVWQL